MTRWLSFVLCAGLIAVIIDDIAILPGFVNFGRETKPLRLNVGNTVDYPRVLVAGLSAQDVLRQIHSNIENDLSDDLDISEEDDESDPLDEDCLSVADWQTTSFPTCNTLHEISMKGPFTEIIAKGSIRNVWKVHPSTGGIYPIIFKNPRLYAEINRYSMLNFENNRKEGLIMEALSSSPYVMNIYGFCGVSTMTEVAIPLAENDIDMTEFSTSKRLQFSANAAQSLAQTQDIGSSGFASVVHRDVKPDNFFLSPDMSHLLIDDFNYAEFRKVHKDTNVLCPLHRFESACADGSMRSSPEECFGGAINEKIDVYRLGNILYFILTGIIPYREFKEHKHVEAGGVPSLPEEYETSTDPTIIAMKEAIYSCYAYFPEERPQAIDVANKLLKALEVEHLTDDNTIDRYKLFLKDRNNSK